MSLSRPIMKSVVEALLFVSERPLSLRQLLSGVRQASRRHAEFQGNSAEQPEAAGLNTPEVHTSIEDPVNIEPEFIGHDHDSTDDVLSQLMAKGRELDNDVSRDEVRGVLEELAGEYSSEDRGLELVQVAKGYQLRTKLDVSYYLRSEKKTAFVRLSPSAMETLAIVAYKQPVSRSSIEGIRGVDTGGVLKTLLDREFVRIVGRSEEPGRPLVYGTTSKFLEVFGLNGLKDLPSPAEFLDMGVTAEGDEDGDADAVDEGYFSSGDFSDAPEGDLDDTERAILDELDQSLEQLKEVESTVTFFGDGTDADKKNEVVPTGDDGVQPDLAKIR